MPAFLLPDLGEGLTEAEIVAWHVRVGDTVAVDQDVVEVETAKAVVEIPVPFAGRVEELHAGPGELLAVGDPLITVSEDQPEGESGNVLIGYGTSVPGPRRRRADRNAPPEHKQPEHKQPEHKQPERKQPVHNGHPGPNGQAVRDEAPGTNGQEVRTEPSVSTGVRPPVVSPIVRRLARNAGLDLAAIRGSGRDGLITRQDVDEAIAAHPAVPAAESPVDEAAAAQAPAAARGASAGEVVRIPLQGIRKIAADKFSRSRREIPEATVWVDVDATELLSLRATLNADGREPKIGLLALLSRFAILGLSRHPELNARVDGDVIVMGPSVHLGFAAQTDRGLMVPVVADAQACNLEQLSSALAETTLRTRNGALAPAELTGGTFTINNYGMFGVDGSAAIINHPEVAILGIGRIIPRPWIVDGQVTARQLTQLTLAFDHRVCDGQVAGGFLRFVADCIESPAKVMRYL